MSASASTHGHSLLAEIAEHVVFDQIFVAWMANADTHAPVIVADMLGDRAQTVVTGNPAANFDSHLARRKLDFVMENRDRIGCRSL